MRAGRRLTAIARAVSDACTPLCSILWHVYHNRNLSAGPYRKNARQTSMCLCNINVKTFVICISVLGKLQTTGDRPSPSGMASTLVIAHHLRYHIFVETDFSFSFSIKSTVAYFFVMEFLIPNCQLVNLACWEKRAPLRQFSLALGNHERTIVHYTTLTWLLARPYSAGNILHTEDPVCFSYNEPSGRTCDLPVVAMALSI